MNRTPDPADGFPKIKSLAEQVADHLRTFIQRGVWQNFLPPERSLCRMTSVSRPILRQAVRHLQDAGLLQVRHGCPTRILARLPEKPPRTGRKQVVMLSAQSLLTMDRWHLMAVDAIRKTLYEHGVRFDLVTDLRLGQKQRETILHRLVRQHQADHWILSSLPLAVQKFFQIQRCHAVVMGHAFPGIRFSSVDYDLRAITRHAAGTLLGLGHRRIAFLIRRSNVAGALAGEEGFAEALAVQSSATFKIVRHSGNPDQVRSCLRRLLEDSRRPTALLISHAIDALVALNYLPSAGFRVPDDVSLVAEFTENFLEAIRPVPARYVMDALKLAHGICRLIDRTRAAPRSIRLVPVFLKGETLGPAPKSHAMSGQ